MYNYMIENLSRQKDKIDEMIRGYQPAKDLIEWRILNENEEVDNLYVSNKTLFINDSKMVLKGVDGSLEKWDIKKTYPIDKKDEKINQLEEEIKKLKEALNEPTKLNESIRKRKQPNGSDDVNAEPQSETISGSVSE